jgi:hypothetical protein
MREALFGKRLEYQSRNATRRLQELIYECVGEYDKTHRRALGRAGFLDSDSENQVGRSLINHPLLSTPAAPATDNSITRKWYDEASRHNPCNFAEDTRRSCRCGK